MATRKSVGTTGNVNGIRIDKNNIKDVLSQLDGAVQKALTEIGIKAEKYAKAKCPVGKGEWIDKNGKKHVIKGYRGGTLRNSITFEVESTADGGEVVVGSNVEYAPYVELGTGPNFQAPPSWETFQSSKGSGGGSGYVHPRPYLRPAIEDHLGEYANIIKSELE